MTSAETNRDLGRENRNSSNDLQEILERVRVSYPLSGVGRHHLPRIRRDSCMRVRIIGDICNLLLAKTIRIDNPFRPRI